jgi:hypothetical protein
MIPGAAYVDPSFSWFTPVAPTGIRFLDSCRWPADLRYDCFVGDANGGRLYRFDMNGDRTGFNLPAGVSDGVADSSTERDLVVWGTGFGSLTDVQVGPDGYLYVASIGAGGVYRVRPVFPMGDIDRDGSVTGADEVLFVDLLLGFSSDPQRIQQGDFDGDGAVSALDLPCFTRSRLLPQ